MSIADPVEVFEAARPRLLGVAYRMLGSLNEADDVVQDAWCRWDQAQQADPPIANPDAWLTTVTSRLALDRLRSARHRRERYVGPWLPEPVVVRSSTVGSPPPADPAEAAELADSLTFAFLTLLDALEPVERAVVLLADVFSVPFAEIAPVVGKSEAACRQVASRARRRLRDRSHRPGRHPSSAEERRVVDELLVAIGLGDMDRVLARLAPDVVAVTDGGASIQAARHPVVGADRVGRFFVNLAHRSYTTARFEPATVNGRPGVVIWVDDRVDSVLSFDVDHTPEGDRVAAIWVVRNPDKLDANAMDRGAAVR